ncbi:MAG: cysteine synthase CysM [Bacteroidales bacterium]|jgi:cysteine synthase B
MIDLIGNTPLVKLEKIVPGKNVRLYAKLEGRNPGGSVKDRPALNMIIGALERGEIGTQTKLIEPTSGNTGIALAMIANLFNLQIELVMPEHATKERIKTMKAYGAKVILTPSEKSMEGAIDYACSRVAEGGYKMLNQFANPDNYLAHYKTTGPEIWKDTEGKITHFVSSMGTTGTVMGTSMFLKEKKNSITIAGVQPTAGSEIPGIRRWPREYLPEIFDPSRVDTVIDISQEEATETARRLAREEGLFAGMSSGGAVAASLKLAESLDQGVIVCIICDNGDRYLSSGLFAYG